MFFVMLNKKNSSFIPYSFSSSNSPVRVLLQYAHIVTPTVEPLKTLNVSLLSIDVKSSVFLNKYIFTKMLDRPAASVNSPLTTSKVLASFDIYASNIITFIEHTILLLANKYIFIITLLHLIKIKVGANLILPN